ncbi:membrane-associated apoptosis protein-domain-containing protein [Tribonema minus]|uniref:Membrane-associated apoptosis protein-domain-containing protein n=1 Tax=Tribonema minus TaxID=303371 RepID=A0A836CNH1_9STRA|nr:membrane-associated apoptosis protein-domain-containing protein [Tribonema minus]
MEAEAAAKTVGRCRTLRRYCDGMMARLLYINTNALSPNGCKRPLCLQSSDYASKMKKKLESSFPDAPDICKNPQFDITAGQMIGQLQDIYDCFEEVAELREGMLETLRDVSGCRNGATPHLKMDLTPTLLGNFMGLLTSFTKLHVVISRVDERKAALGLYFAAAAAARRRAEPAWPAVAALVAASDDPVHAAAAALGGAAHAPLHACALACLGEVSDAVALALDPERLRAISALSALAGGAAALALPAAAPLGPRAPTVPLHFAIARGAQYAEWVLYTGLALPAAVFNSAPAQELFVTVASEALVVDVVRGAAPLAVHAELERLAAWFPPKGAALPLLGKMKFKEYVKELRKAAAAASGVQQRRRRVYLAGELQELKLVVRRAPGLLGPKFPVVFAALAMARAETLCYWRHRGQVASKKDKDASQFDDALASALIGAADAVHGLVVKHAAAVRRYYAEYLRGAHAHALAPLIAAACANPDVTAKLGQGMTATLAGLLRHFEFDVTAVAGDAAEFRWDCDRLVGALADPSAHLLRAGEVEALLRRLSTVRLHSQLVDALPSMLSLHVELRDAWWHLGAVRDDFSTCLYGSDPSMGRYALAYLYALAAAQRSAVPECPEELSIIGGGSAQECESMADEVAARVEQLLGLLVRETQALEQRASPAEAFTRYVCMRKEERTASGLRCRYERLQVAATKARKGMAVAPVEEPLPGSESSGTAHDKVQSLVAYRRSLAAILEGLESVDRGDGPLSMGILAYDRLIVPREFVRRRVEAFFRGYLRRATVYETCIERPSVALDAVTRCVGVMQLFVCGVRESEMKACIETCIERPSIALDAVTRCVGVMQSALAGAGLDVDGMVRRVLLDECSQWTRTSDADAAAAPAAPQHRTVLDSFVLYYVYMLKRMSPEGDLGLGAVYVAAREGFVCTPSAPKSAAPIDLYMDKQELRAFCALFGGGGARALEQALQTCLFCNGSRHVCTLTRCTTTTTSQRAQAMLGLVSGRVREIQQLLSSMAPALSRFKDAHDRGGGQGWDEALRSLAPLEKLLQHSIAIGTALTLRRLLREALSEVCSKSMPGVHATAAAAAAMLDAGIAAGNGAPCGDVGAFVSLASDLGVALASGDFGLETALSEAAQSGAGVWPLLPYAYAAIFAADAWKCCRFVSALEGFERGEHMAVPAMTALFAALLGPGDAAAVAALRAYADCAALTLLRMKLGARALYREWRFPEMLAFLDRFVEECDAVDRSAVEGLVPYALTHAAYLEMGRAGVA